MVDDLGQVRRADLYRGVPFQISWGNSADQPVEYLVIHRWREGDRFLDLLKRRCIAVLRQVLQHLLRTAWLPLRCVGSCHSDSSSLSALGTGLFVMPATSMSAFEGLSRLSTMAFWLIHQISAEMPLHFVETCA